MRLRLTLFPTLKKPVGHAASIEAATPQELPPRLQRLLQDTSHDCQLWQGAAFENNHRSNEYFLEAGLVTVDADYDVDHRQRHVPPPASVAREIEGSMREGRFRATLGHLTPRGIRLVLLLRVPICSVTQRISAGLGAMVMISEDLRNLGLLANLGEQLPGYSLDECSKKAAQAMWLPNFSAFGKRRQSEVILIPGSSNTHQVFDTHELTELVPTSLPTTSRAPVFPASDTRVINRPGNGTSVEQAVVQFNKRHIIDFAQLGRTCPTCAHRGCFNEIPGSNGRKWFCHSSSHAQDSCRDTRDTPCGRRTPNGFVGDALDLVAHARGVGRIEILQQDGLLAVRRGRRRTISFRLGE